MGYDEEDVMPIVYVGGAIGFILFMCLLISAFVAWLTHVVVCLMAGAYMLLVVGALFAPIGIIHGYMTWFGYQMVIF